MSLTQAQVVSPVPINKSEYKHSYTVLIYRNHDLDEPIDSFAVRKEKKGFPNYRDLVKFLSERGVNYPVAKIEIIETPPFSLYGDG